MAGTGDGTQSLGTRDCNLPFNGAAIDRFWFVKVIIKGRKFVIVWGLR